MFTIYQIINSINGKSYVGFTSLSVEKRWKEHHYLAGKGATWALSQAIRKYGFEAFRVEKLEEGSDPKIGLEIREPYWISVLKPEYNMTFGGEGTLGIRRTKRTEESKLRTSVSLKGNQNALGAKHSEKSISARAAILRGKTITDEQKRAISEGLVGNKNALGCKHPKPLRIQFGSANMSV